MVVVLLTRKAGLGEGGGGSSVNNETGKQQ
jgi:hypothetical protein